MSTSTGAITTVWTPGAVRQLGMTTDVATASAILGIGRSRAYELAERGESPVNVLRVGWRHLVATSAAGSARVTNGRPHRVGTRTPASAVQTDQPKSVGTDLVGQHCGQRSGQHHAASLAFGMSSGEE